MAQQDLDAALAALADETVQAQIASGDLSAFADLNLTDEERQLVVDAAGDLPEVSGFAFGDLIGTSSVDHKDWIIIESTKSGFPGKPGSPKGIVDGIFKL